jgi:hypothetical protein
VAQLRAELVPRRNGRSGFNTVFSAKMVSTRCCRPKWFPDGIVCQSGFNTVLCFSQDTPAVAQLRAELV